MEWIDRSANARNAYLLFIENIALKLKVNAEEVYIALTEKSSILNDYIVPEYETLHTQSKEYIVDDIIEVMEERGVKI